MEGSAGFAGIAGEGATVFETNGADGKIDAEAQASGKFYVAIECPSIKKDKPSEGTFEGVRVFGIGNPPRSSTERVTIDFGAQFAFGERADGVSPTEELA